MILKVAAMQNAIYIWIEVLRVNLRNINYDYIFLFNINYLIAVSSGIMALFERCKTDDKLVRRGFS